MEPEKVKKLLESKGYSLYFGRGECTKHALSWDYPKDLTDHCSIHVAFLKDSGDYFTFSKNYSANIENSKIKPPIPFDDYLRNTLDTLKKRNALEAPFDIDVKPVLVFRFLGFSVDTKGAHISDNKISSGIQLWAKVQSYKIAADVFKENSELKRIIYTNECDKKTLSKDIKAVEKAFDDKIKSLDLEEKTSFLIEHVENFREILVSPKKEN